eukprot:7387286-Prymnesium_polylepis.1
MHGRRQGGWMGGGSCLRGARVGDGLRVHSGMAARGRQTEEVYGRRAMGGDGEHAARPAARTVVVQCEPNMCMAALRIGHSSEDRICGM